MKILITGGEGLIGSKIAERLSLFNDVYILDKKDDSLRNTNTLYLNITEYDMIIHCASNCVIRDVIKDTELATENMEGTRQVLELAKRTGCKKIVMFSSSRVESNNHNPYITSKKYMEEQTKAYQECYGIDYIIIRPETVWGPNDNKVRVIPTWINNALNNKPLIVYGDKDKELPPIFVDDFVELLMEYITEFDEHKNNTYTIKGWTLKVRDIIKTIKKLTKSKSRIVYKKAELSQPQYVKAINKFIKITGEYNFETRLEEVLEWKK